ncbi:Bug family tripartite tricarboxylate transporter substrate binding protein [Pigmentiphaga litoralis]|uniref:Bug family tripartite tricarboxylate transporter substrate binding protein n=1 Tax=Pigmentiphaga litoralis TaxID=516702 RepID=UPI00389A6126
MPAVQAEETNWPTHTVTIIVPFPAGGSQDAIARMMAKHLEDALGKTFVVLNRAGAAGNIGTRAGVKAKSDGYTFVLSSSGPLANNRFLYDDLGYDPSTDISPVSLVGQFPMLIVSGKHTGVEDLQSYVASANKAPGLDIGTPGPGSMGDLTARLLESTTQTKLLLVPYQGGAPAMNAAIAKEIGLAVDVVNAATVGMIKDGRLNAVAITSRERFPGLPNLKTATEQGYPGLSASVHFALVGPKEVAPAIIVRLNSEINRFLSLPSTIEKFYALGAQPIGGSPQAVTDMISDTIARWKSILQQAASSK